MSGLELQGVVAGTPRGLPVGHHRPPRRERPQPGARGRRRRRAVQADRQEQLARRSRGRSIVPLSARHWTRPIDTAGIRLKDSMRCSAASSWPTRSHSSPRRSRACCGRTSTSCPTQRGHAARPAGGPPRARSRRDGHSLSRSSGSRPPIACCAAARHARRVPDGLRRPARARARLRPRGPRLPAARLRRRRARERLARCCEGSARCHPRSRRRSGRLPASLGSGDADPEPIDRLGPRRARSCSSSRRGTR